MNLLAKRLEAIEAAIAKQHGADIKFVVRADDDESDEEARERAGLGEHSGSIVFLIPSDLYL